MKSILIKSLKNQRVLADECFVANRFLSRMKGLIGQKSLAPGKGLLLLPCREIHMWMMSIPIDVVFIQKTKEDPRVWKVTSTRKALRPWKCLPVSDSHADATIELPIHSIDAASVEKGDLLWLSLS